ncbi:MAG: hypothetical protein VB093_01475 [Propionicimonas sp.]|nr:hypothetical protein [Propionicimonas sp.]
MTETTRNQGPAAGGADAAPRRLLIASHCVLNQNAVVQPLARSAGVMRSAVDWAIANGYAIYQLPCPEFRYAGPGRLPASFDDYNTEGFHASNVELLGPVIRQLKRYQAAGYQIVGGLHVQGSPACDPDTGNWITDLLDAAAAAGIEITQLWQVPTTATGEFDPADPQTCFGDPAVRRLYPDDAGSLTLAQRKRREQRAPVLVSDGPALPVRRTRRVAVDA